MSKKTICVDFDGVIHLYSKGFQKENSCYDEEVEGAIESLVRLVKRGYKVVVLTARTDFNPVIAWLDQEFRKKNEDFVMSDIEVTNVKPIAIAYIDDRAIRFTNWKDMLNYF